MLASCGDEVSFDASNEAPKVGTSYIALQYDYDTTKKIRLHFQDTVRVTVDPTRSPFEGKGDVVPFVTVSDIPLSTLTLRDTIHMHYEPNGDITAFQRGGTMTSPGGGMMPIPDAWIIYPFGSKVDTTQTLLDTTYSYGSATSPMTATIKVTSAQEFLGPDQIATEQGNLFVVKVKSEQTWTVIDNGFRTQVVRSIIAYYAPKLGAVAQLDFTELSDFGQGLIERKRSGWQIASYTLVK